MEENKFVMTSKFLSLVLRHKPETIGLELDANGWASVEDLLQKMSAHKHMLSREGLEAVVSSNDKKRFAFNEDGTRIRASQGHSIEIELNVPAQVPPPILYHGTIAGFIENIKITGLQKMARRHVHLSADKETARKVGGRKGKPVILTVRTGDMHQEGFSFYLSDNGVWLTDTVPANYICFEE